jgi:DnaJ-class molecular chaperone
MFGLYAINQKNGFKRHIHFQELQMAKDYYAILGVPRDAPEDQIKKAYRNLAMQFHPDKNPGKESWANEKFKEINEAFGVLGNPEKRRQYDQFGVTGSANDVFSNAATNSTFEEMMRDFGGSGLGLDFLEKIFGDSFKNSGHSFRIYRYGGGSPGGVDLGDLFGQAQGQQFQYQTPDTANYEIIINSNQAKKGFEKDLVRNGHRLKVKIPKNIMSGTKIRLNNALLTTDRRAGDIIITVMVK